MLKCGQPELLQIIGTRDSPSCFPGRLNGWQKETDKNTDDGDDHQQLDEGEGGPLMLEPHDVIS